jgi:hypothetical protein
MFLVPLKKYVSAEKKEPWGALFSGMCTLVEVFHSFRAMCCLQVQRISQASN